ncbi:MAG TPA: DegT/DnrJ/EryC1/StrS family aminotransferase [Syntrophorhabdaceae bacterium]|nr:DegT/DnrJ/EryC1/StrS family aminotransferase [Syntrophorhabdaceae bacterium]
MEFFDTHISSQAVEMASSVLKSTWISEGKLVKDFETALTRLLGLKNPVAVNSGTSALHLALVLSGVGPGDEVILPAQTFIATGLAVLMQGAQPVFADIDLHTANIDPASIRAKLTSRTKAIMVVHWGGYPCPMDEISAIAGERGLPVIEDAAHALGATYKERTVGSISRFTAFSFQAIKHLTTGDGGALCSIDDEDYRQCKIRRWFGIDRENSVPSVLGERSYDVANVGYKYHMNDLSAAVGLGNLEDIFENLARRREIAARYRDELSAVPGLTLIQCDKESQSACWLFTMLVEQRDDFIQTLKEHGIPASVVHQRIDRNSVFGGMTEGLTSQDLFEKKQISIPVHGHLNDDHVDLIIKTIRNGW